MKALRFFFLTTIIALLASCGKDTGSEDSSNGITGWYVDSPTPAEVFGGRIAALNADIKKMESSGDGWTFEWVTVDQCYGEDGFLNTYFGEAYASGNLPYTMTFGHLHYDFIHIIDGTTLAYYENCAMYKDGSSGTIGKDKLYTFKFGKIGPLDFGNVSFYGKATHYVYSRDGNKLTIKQGGETVDIIASNGTLISNGGSKMVKYDSKKVN